MLRPCAPGLVFFFLCASFLPPARADDAVDSALPGCYRAASGATLRVERRGEGFCCRLPGEERPRPLSLSAPGLVQLGAASGGYRLGVDAGRPRVEGPGGPYLRELRSPWWRLPDSLRQALRRPLGDPEGRPELEEACARWVAARYAPLQVPAEAARAEYRYLQLDPDQRRGLLALQAKMHADGVWRLVGAIHYVGGDGVLLFAPRGTQEALRRALGELGFGDWWRASRGRPWGVRSRYRGLQLHFRGSEERWVNVHIDFVNPGDPPGGPATSAAQELGLAWRHYQVDLRGWSANHTPARLAREMQRAGFTLPSVE